jgi:hypothetical protein
MTDLLGVTKWVLAALVVLTSACASTRGLQIESAGSIGCEPSAIEVTQVRSGVNGRSWLASCDGGSFQCSSASEGCVNCAPVRPRGASGGAATDEREPSRDGDDDGETARGREGPRFEFSRDGASLRAVRATFTTPTSSIVFTFAPAHARDAVRVRVTAREGVVLAECLAFVLVDERGRPLLSEPVTDREAMLPRAALAERTQAEPAPTVEYCGRRWPLSRADVHGFERFDAYMEEALTATPEAPTTHEPSTAPALAEGVADAVRAQLHERRAMLRACAGVGAVTVLAVEATWDAAGAMQVRVNGRDDQAVHDCATSVLRGRRAPEGAPGRLIHVLAPD